MNSLATTLALGAVTLGAPSAALSKYAVAQPAVATSAATIVSSVSQVEPGTWMISSDNGRFSGGIAHQVAPAYRIEKQLNVPADLLARANVAALRVYMDVRDNSWFATKPQTTNGLDEAFEIKLNDRKFQVKTSDPRLFSHIAPTTTPVTMPWTDFLVPVSALKAGVNTIEIYKLPNDKPASDDYVYVGIDNSAHAGASSMSQDGGATWQQKELNTIGATGEYMIRLVLSDRDSAASAQWTPAGATDPNRMFGYIEATPAGAKFEAELDTSQMSNSTPLTATLHWRGAPAAQIAWTDEDGKPLQASGQSTGSATVFEFPLGRRHPARVEVTGGVVSDLRIDYTKPLIPDLRAADMALPCAAPAGKPARRAPGAHLVANGFVLENSLLRATFTTVPRLKLVSLFHELLGRDVLAHPELTHLFTIEVTAPSGELKRYIADDWQVQSVQPLPAPRHGYAVQLALPEAGLRARFTAATDEDFKADADTIAGIRLGLAITNVGKASCTWKTAFPQVGGIELSPARQDSYLFPYRGGIIGNIPADMCASYGNQSAWWQMMDVFSPSGGAGLSLRIDDRSGLYKEPCLHTGALSEAGFDATLAGSDMDPALLWRNRLQAGPGSEMTWDYLRRTRAPGGSFAPPDGVLEAHTGDWHVAMRDYADWAHRAWKWRPWPSKLHDVWNINAVGWGSKPLFKDGKYDTSYVNDTAEISELMSWWEPSERGPWRVPIDRMKQELGDAAYNAYKGYVIKDPVTGRMEYTLNRGNYVGTYHTAWGGLPALRAHLDAMRRGGQLAMLYTDPILADDNTDLGHNHGPKYGVMNPYWQDTYHTGKTPPGYVGSYLSWNMCPDTQWYQDFLVKQMSQIIKETGADGIRLDEYGHRGYACTNPNHQHIFAEPGHNAWLQAIGQAIERIHAGLDKVKPGTLLTTEFPGNDYVAKGLDGALDYESSANTISLLRPIPLNIFRFYFPEHKLFDLDNRHAPHGQEWRFWNATGSFEVLYAPRYHRVLLENGDAFGTTTPRPLIPTLASRVYANRFSIGQKQITTLYNARGFTVEAPILKADAAPGMHYFDLLNGCELKPHAGALIMKLAPDAAGCVARLPVRLHVLHQGAAWRVSVANAPLGAVLILCSADGSELMRRPAAHKVDFTSDSADAAYIKLVSGKYLVDAAAPSG